MATASLADDATAAAIVRPPEPAEAVRVEHAAAGVAAAAAAEVPQSAAHEGGGDGGGDGGRPGRRFVLWEAIGTEAELGQQRKVV